MDPLRGAVFPMEGAQGDGSTSQSLNASAAAIQNLIAQAARNSAFNRVPGSLGPQAMYNDMVAQALQPQPQLVHLLAQAGAGLSLLGMPQQQMVHPAEVPLPNGRARQTRSGDGRTATNNSYASRHQQAEARRRSRINERLDALRKIVPHTERANTAAFLEDVVRYVQRLQHRVLELELKLGLPTTVTPPSVPIAFGESTTPDGTVMTTTTNAPGIDRMALHAVLQQAAATVAAMPGAPQGGAQQSSAPGALQIQNNTGTQRALPSVSEELAMAAQLAPMGDTSTKAMMAESQPVAGPSGTANGTGENGPQKGTTTIETIETVKNGTKRELPAADIPAAAEEPEGKRLRSAEVS